VSTTIPQRVQSLEGLIDKVNEKIAGLEKDIRALDGELSSLSKQRQQYRLLGDICASLDQLNEMGAVDLFWGREATGYDPDAQLRRVRGVVAEFEKKIAVIEQSRTALQNNIKKESVAAFLLKDELAELLEVSERVKNEYVLERQANEIPYRPMVLPWSRQGEDEKRFRKVLFFVFLFSFLLTWVLPLLKQPEEKYKEIVVPEHIAQMIKRKQEEKQIVQKKQEQLTEKRDTNVPSKEVKPITTETQQARAVAQTKGVLAFKNNFADLMEDSAPVKMGIDARISNSGKMAAGNGGKNVPGEASQRSLITSQATGGSGGINTASLSRQGLGSGGAGGGGSGGQSITGAGVKFARVESATGAGMADDRPLSKGAGPSRTDEEIQIVFDRYKSALYRIYNRELRIDPSLRGKMVLRLTIEPDGRVSACTIKSTDLASQALSADIVDRVLKFNFGPKEGVHTLTILYPIDFLPAS